MKVSTPIVVVIVVIAVIALVAYGWKTMAGPTKVTPEEMRKHMPGAEAMHGK